MSEKPIPYPPETSQLKTLDKAVNVLNQGSPITEMQLFETAADANASNYGSEILRDDISTLSLTVSDNGRIFFFGYRENENITTFSVPDENEELDCYALEPLEDGAIKIFRVNPYHKVDSSDKTSDYYLEKLPQELKDELFIGIFNGLIAEPYMELGDEILRGGSYWRKKQIKKTPDQSWFWESPRLEMEIVASDETARGDIDIVYSVEELAPLDDDSI